MGLVSVIFNFERGIEMGCGALLIDNEGDIDRLQQIAKEGLHGGWMKLFTYTWRKLTPNTIHPSTSKGDAHKLIKQKHRVLTRGASAVPSYPHGVLQPPSWDVQCLGLPVYLLTTPIGTTRLTAKLIINTTKSISRKTTVDYVLPFLVFNNPTVGEPWTCSYFLPCPIFMFH